MSVCPVTLRHKPNTGQQDSPQSSPAGSEAGAGEQQTAVMLISWRAIIYPATSPGYYPAPLVRLFLSMISKYHHNNISFLAGSACPRSEYNLRALGDTISD